MRYQGQFLGLVIAVSVFILAQPSWAVAEERARIFSLQRVEDLNSTPPELDAPYVEGLSWRFGWQKIEPQEGQFSWSTIDKVLEVTSRAGKKVMLRVVAGINSPEWIYQARAKPFEFQNSNLAHPENYPTNLRMPIPWDEVYLSKWEAFIRAFGQRYNGNPNIYCIHMSGGGYIGELNLPKTYKKWEQAGYSDEKLIAAWKRIIDAYQKAFPTIPTTIAINEPLGVDRSHVMGPVVAYALEKYPGKVYIQHNGLQATYPKQHRIRETLREAARKTVVGYQMVGGKGWLENRVGDRTAAFRNALEDHASYIEVYASDIRDPLQKSALQFLATAGRER
jgi:Beta-galactosidase